MTVSKRREEGVTTTENGFFFSVLMENGHFSVTAEYLLLHMQIWSDREHQVYAKIERELSGQMMKGAKDGGGHSKRGKTIVEKG